jgi:phage-related protein
VAEYDEFDTPADFKFLPDWSPEFAVSPRITKVEFGDGFAQRTTHGLNSQLETVRLTFSGRLDRQARKIIAFFEKHRGVIPFTAQIGFNSPIKKYVTEGEWKHTIVWNDHNDITVTFQEVP